MIVATAKGQDKMRHNPLQVAEGYVAPTRNRYKEKKIKKAIPGKFSKICRPTDQSKRPKHCLCYMLTCDCECHKRKK